MKIDNKNEQNEWLNASKAKLFVPSSSQWYHHHANEILSFSHNYKNQFIEALTQEIQIVPRIKKANKKPTKGIEAKDLNKEIRRLLKTRLTELREEVNEKHGVYYYTTNDKKQVAGFDFAILNSKKNLLTLHNLCFGDLSYRDGEKKWKTFIKKNPDLQSLAENIENNKEIQLEENTPLILGEIQFGNWALAYRDLFKVLKANVQTSVDCLIYICPTGNLESMLSDGIVTFDKTKKILIEFSKVISVPIWLVGLDIELNLK